MESFLNELTENERLRELFLAQNSMDGAYSVAKPYLSGMSKDEFSREMTGLARNIVESGELPPEALESVSGGAMKPWDMIGKLAAFGGLESFIKKGLV
ncbi:MAG: hypothetical protein RUMPE_01127 [Eubacteriales bacterium SKADARSKE-1]|nr:hypothetical protein [Eubacteriales bacterium SKADARSKE-1]